MDVSALPVGLRIEVAVLSKMKEQSELQGQAALELIDAAAASGPPRVPAEAHRGRNINIRA